MKQRRSVLQNVPSGAVGLEHWPVLGSQLPATWHWSDAVQTTGLLPVQVPLWHVSTAKQRFPVLQAAPLGFAGLEH
jgi:hypothetical protein